MIHSLWYKERIDDPKQVIEVTFGNTDIGTLKRFVTDLFTSACHKSPCQHYSIADIFYYLKQVEAIINASFLLNLQKTNSSIVINEFELFNPRFFRGKKNYVNNWDYYPKGLSLQEFINPYAAFSKAFEFCSIKEWKKRLDVIVTYAFDKGTFSQDSIEIEIIGTYLQLTAMLEAAHLIDVREKTV
jgi:hypothetical protein